MSYAIKMKGFPFAGLDRDSDTWELHLQQNLSNYMKLIITKSYPLFIWRGWSGEDDSLTLTLAFVFISIIAGKSLLLYFQYVK